MGQANGICVEDLDLSDTLDVCPRYSDVVYLYQDGSPGADAVGNAWLCLLEEV
jgi:hypothetical protein